MKNVLVKKIIIICSVMLTIIVSAVLIAVISGNTKVPAISDPNKVFYQRLDDDGNVIYEITNKDLFEEIKSNDGLEQLLYLVDSDLLASYIATIASDSAAVANKIKELTYGTSDDTVIAEMDADTKTKMELTYQQSMLLAGYSGNEEEYAVLSLAREAFVRAAVDEDGDVTDLKVAAEYVNNYFLDCTAIKIRFTSEADGKAVMKKFNLLSLGTTEIRSYLGYVFNSETLKDPSSNIVEAYITVVPYYYDSTTRNLLNLADTVVYTKGTGNIYTDSAAKEYSIDANGNLIDAELNIVVAAYLIKESKTEAQTVKTENTTYFTVSKNDPFDMSEKAAVKNSINEVVYYVDSANKVYDASLNEITNSGLIVNKVYKAIADVSTVTTNNSAAMSDDQILAAYIKMYNYVYGYRTPLAENATQADLVALNSEYLIQNFEKVNAVSSTLSKYLFDTLDLTSTVAKPYSIAPKSIPGAKDTSHYMIYKLTQPVKVDAYKIMLNYVEERIVVPADVTSEFTLPSAGWYGSKIAWKSGTTATVTIAAKTNADGLYVATVTKPEADTSVTLTYTITLGGEVRTGTKTVNVKTSGKNSEVVEPTGEEISFKTILADNDLFDTLYNKLIDAIMNDSNNLDTTMNSKLAALRSEHNFALYDYYMGLDYAQIDKDFESVAKGSKTVLASYDDEEITADEMFDYCVGKNGALYSLYSVQLKEMIYSSFFSAQGMFGTQRNIERNKSDKMDDMYQSVASAKSYYAYLGNLYAQYGMEFPYSSFMQYAYLQYGTKTEMDLLKYFVEGAIQPFIINEAIEEYDLIDLFVDSVEDYYNNYFSLNITHLIISLDFDEDGSPDDYNEYLDSLDAADRLSFDARIADFEAQITTYLDAATTNTFTTLITAYRAATREDATWGRFKQYGYVLITEDLNIADEEDDTKTHSLEYSGTYGVKDTYVQEYVDALIALYQEYQDPQNIEQTSLRSDLVKTVYGLHLILATKGDNFERISAKFTDSNNTYTAGSANDSDIPSLDQMKLYAKYYFYSSVYDLTAKDVEEIYGITVPNIPAPVSTALDFYFSDLLESLFVVGTVNIRVVDRMTVGEFAANDSDYKAKLVAIKNVYDTALFGDYRN